MKLYFLGTSHGVPEKDRFCSGTLIETGDKYYIIDCGFPVINQLKKNDLDINRVAGVFITHMHADHTMGLPHYMDLLKWYYKESDPEFYLAEEEGIAAYDAFLNYVVGGRALKCDFVKEGVFFEDENVRITAFATRHCQPRPSFAFLVEAEGKRVFFTGDLKGDLSDMPEFARTEHTDALICEAAHNRLNKVADQLYALPTDMLIINHISFINPESISTPFAEAAPMKCIISSDNDVIEV